MLKILNTQKFGSKKFKKNKRKFFKKFQKSKKFKTVDLYTKINNIEF